jgi:N-acetylmuramoyl-L-alanine amidase
MDTPSFNPLSSTDTPAKPGSDQKPMTTFRALQTVIAVGILVATLFTIWTPASFLSNDLAEKINLLAQKPAGTPAAGVAAGTGPVSAPTATALANPRIGLVAGHHGNDSGSVCSDGLTEADVNFKIASLVAQNLSGQGFSVDLLDEFDLRLYQYQALVLVSIHNDSCDYVNDQATGFKVAAAASSLYPEEAARLTACLTDRYAKATSLPFHFHSITPDMTEYHAFDEINSKTPAAIIETGFLNLDRQILTSETDRVARGVSDGILCFIRNESVDPTATPPTP